MAALVVRPINSANFKEDITIIYTTELPSASFEWPVHTPTTQVTDPRPIMSRLPSNEQNTQNDNLSYIYVKSSDKVLGTLPYQKDNEGLSYTVSHLPEIEDASFELWKALHSLRPLSTNYESGMFSAKGMTSKSSRCPFAPSTTADTLDFLRKLFNWSSLRLPLDMNSTFYGVVFRSRRAPGSESTNFYLADKLAHEEAVNSGGLLMYFYGLPDPETGLNLATCIWASREAAVKASKLPRHREAVSHAVRAYDWYQIDRYAVVKMLGNLEVTVEAWDDRNI